MRVMLSLEEVEMVRAGGSEAISTIAGKNEGFLFTHYSLSPLYLADSWSCIDTITRLYSACLILGVTRQPAAQLPFFIDH